MRSYDQKDEDEANWLAWSLLLPREEPLARKRENLTPKQIADRFWA